jgi:hypothetical protein
MDKKRFQAEFTDSQLELTGEIVGVYREQKEVALLGVPNGTSINCRFADANALGHLHNGQKVTVRGQYNGNDPGNGPLIEACTLVSAGTP